MYKWSFPKSFKKSIALRLDILEVRELMKPQINGTRKCAVENVFTDNFAEYLKLVEIRDDDVSTIVTYGKII